MREDPGPFYIDNDPSATVEEWIMFLQFLWLAFGATSVLCTDAGHNNVELILTL